MTKAEAKSSGVDQEVVSLRSTSQQQEPLTRIHPTTRERPILFSGEMVLAILEGQKTQTRRVILRREKNEGEWVTARPDRGYTPETIAAEYRCPFGAVGGRLWVRETFASLVFERDWESGYVDGWHPAGNHESGVRVYAADPHGFDDAGASAKERGFSWTPGIFMPRHASRIDLEITGLRVERVWDISWTDCKAEGMAMLDDDNREEWSNVAPPGETNWGTLQDWYRMTWDELNEKRGYGWDTNPWVWVIEFRRVEAVASEVDCELAVD